MNILLKGILREFKNIPFKLSSLNSKLKTPNQILLFFNLDA